MTRSSFDAVIEVIEALQAHAIPYMLVGAFSSNAYSYPRATNDANLGKDPHHQMRFSRRRRMQLPDLKIEAVIPTAEDVVIQKLRWQREKDIADARLVIQIQSKQLDWAYVRRWTDEHGTTDLLEQLRVNDTC